MIDFNIHEHHKIKRLNELEVKEWLITVLKNLLLTCDVSKTKEEFISLVNNVYRVSCDFDNSIYDIKIGIRELINNYIIYRQVSAAMLQSAIKKAKDK